jgi:hypothetical protein
MPSVTVVPTVLKRKNILSVTSLFDTQSPNFVDLEVSLQADPHIVLRLCPRRHLRPISLNRVTVTCQDG